MLRFKNRLHILLNIQEFILKCLAVLSLFGLYYYTDIETHFEKKRQAHISTSDSDQQ